MALNNTTGTSGSSRTAPQLTIGIPARVLFSLTLIVGLLAVVINAVYAQSDSTPGADAASTPVATPAATMPRIELQLEEVNESDLGGTVTLYENGDSTIIEFAATGAGGDHPAVIMPGVCGETEGDPVADLELVDNRGKSISTVDISLEDLLAEDHVIEIRMSESENDTVIACALIEGEPSLDPAGTPVASPEATPSATPSASPEAQTGTENGVGGTTDADGTGGTVAQGAEITIKLVDWSETGVTGTAVLTDQGNTTQVVVNIDGPGVVGGHELHIHNGTCGNPGTATYTLNPIDANGTSTSTINLSVDQLTGGNYFINVHPDEENWDAWMVCGNIDADPATGGTSTTTPGTTTTTTPTPASSGVSDGSTGGNTALVTTNAQAGEFPTKVGVGDALRWPSDTRTSVVWALSGISLTLLVSGLIIRHGERTGKKPRFHRLGL